MLGASRAPSKSNRLWIDPLVASTSRSCAATRDHCQSRIMRCRHGIRLIAGRELLLYQRRRSLPGRSTIEMTPQSGVRQWGKLSCRHCSMVRSSALALTIAALCAGPVHAQQTARATGAVDAPAGDDSGLEEVVVTGFRGSVNAAQDEKRAASGVVDVIKAEDIADFPDNNLAESIQRVPGVAISRDGGEGRALSVRGLGPDFTRVRINGMEAVATTGGADANGGVNRGRGFDFNVFASELFNSITVRKTASADVEEGSFGATVDLQTARPLDFTDQLVIAGSAQGGYNDLSEKTDPRLAGLLSWQNAESTFGALVSVAWSQRDVLEEGTQQCALGTFRREWRIQCRIDSARLHHRPDQYRTGRRWQQLGSAALPSSHSTLRQLAIRHRAPRHDWLVAVAAGRSRHAHYRCVVFGRRYHARRELHRSIVLQSHRLGGRQAVDDHSRWRGQRVRTSWCMAFSMMWICVSSRATTSWKQCSSSTPPHSNIEFTDSVQDHGVRGSFEIRVQQSGADDHHAGSCQQ